MAMVSLALGPRAFTLQSQLSLLHRQCGLDAFGDDFPFVFGHDGENLHRQLVGERIIGGDIELPGSRWYASTVRLQLNAPECREDTAEPAPSQAPEPPHNTGPLGPDGVPMTRNEVAASVARRLAQRRP
jgi:hypothetical protein